MRVENDTTRRRFLALFSATGVGATTLPTVLWSLVEEEGKVDVETLVRAEKIAGLEFTDSERELMLQDVNELLENYRALRQVPLENSVAPAFVFNPTPPGVPFRDDFEAPPISPRTSSPRRQREALTRPRDDDELAFLPVTELSRLVRERRITSLELTRLYLDRLERFDETLHCVVTLTRDKALEQARRADAEIDAGRYRGPLHGIPWGAKDLLATRDYPTTWGATPYKDQVLPLDATVVKRLEEAGAVLVAKLALGALAWGDVWFGGRTRNPWNPEQGSSGSSAGSASATAAGLVGFSIGTETLGSIVSPCTRCGASGLRPTFGRVSRHGAMALSWTMDKIGPICRSAEDCALVFDAIHGPDGLDLSVADEPFDWNPDGDVKDLRVGYVESLFEGDPGRGGQEGRDLDLAVLETLRSLGIELVPIELPDLPVSALSFILNAEAAAAFDELTRSNRDDELVRQVRNAWPNAWRQSRFIPAVEYIQANRVRTLLLQAMTEITSRVNVYVAPSFGGSNLLLTNLTGHPTVVVPNGFRDNGGPSSISFMGRLYGEAEALLLARAYQEATGHHRKRPRLV